MQRNGCTKHRRPCLRMRERHYSLLLPPEDMSAPLRESCCSYLGSIHLAHTLIAPYRCRCSLPVSSAHKMSACGHTPIRSRMRSMLPGALSGTLCTSASPPVDCPGSPGIHAKSHSRKDELAGLVKCCRKPSSAKLQDGADIKRCQVAVADSHSSIPPACVPKP